MLARQFGKKPYERFRPDSGNIGVVYLEISLKDFGPPVGASVFAFVNSSRRRLGLNKFINCNLPIFL